MKWRRTKSKDVIDIRGASKGSSSGGSTAGLPGGLGGLAGGGGIVGVIVFLLITFIGGGDGEGGGIQLPGGIELPPGLEDLGFGSAAAPGAEDPAPIPPEEDPQRDLKDFSTYVFEDSQQTWQAIFADSDQSYDNAQLILYSGRVQTEGCGGASSAVGPFYCPADRRIYLDLSFYEEMDRQLGAEGDFAWAYVIAHEMGHHVQTLTGTSDEVARAGNQDPGARNELSVRQELQADCYSGVWGATIYEQGDLEDGDLDEAFTAAEAVGDDTLQENAGRSVNTDSFTHGSSEQRREWFKRGFESGDPTQCDTFSAEI